MKRIENVGISKKSIHGFANETISFPVLQLHRNATRRKFTEASHHWFQNSKGIIKQALDNPESGAIKVCFDATALNPNNFYDINARIIFGLSCLIGNTFSHWNRGSSVFYNRLNGKMNASKKAIRRPEMPDPLHTETKNPEGQGEDVMLLSCVYRKNCYGGESQLLHIEDWSDLSRLLDSRSAWKNYLMLQGDSEFQGKTSLRPVFWNENQRLQVCWSSRNFLPESQQDKDWMSDVAESLRSSTPTFCDVLLPGEIFVFDNRRWLHGRRPIRKDPKMERLLFTAHVDRRDANRGD